MENLGKQLKWLIAIRLVVITSVMLPYALFQLAPRSDGGALVLTPPQASAAADALQRGPSLDIALLQAIAGFAYTASLIYLLLTRVLRQRKVLQAHIQFGGDLALVTLLVYCFGGIASPFSIFYPLVIAVATALLKRRATAVATFAFALYATLVLALYKGVLPMPDGSSVAQGEEMLRRLIYNLAIHFFSFYAVAFLTWFLVASARRMEQELEAKAEDLAALELKYRDVVQSIESGLVTTDPAGIVTSLNRAGLRILRREGEELVGRHIAESGLFTRERWRELSASSRERGRLSSEVEVFRDQEPLLVGFSIAELKDGDNRRTGWILLFQDLTPWRKLEQEMRLKDRMAAAGSLAAGLAHEIGNPLAAISGSVQLLSRSLDPNAEDARKLLSILYKESQRLDRTVKRFLDYARPTRTEFVEFDVGHLLAEQFELLHHSPEVTASHHLDLQREPAQWKVVADPDGISQIFWNLARNALKAMPEGGTLTIRCRALPQGALALEFIDTGRGMSPEERENAFHPFRSSFDQGTGLGLSIVYRIVQDHGGTISVESRPGGGQTRVTIELPQPPP